MKKVNFIARQNGGLLFDRKFSATELYIISTVRQRRLYESCQTGAIAILNTRKIPPSQTNSGIQRNLDLKGQIVIKKFGPIFG